MNEQMSHMDRPPQRGSCGTRQHTPDAKCIGQSFGHRTDVACGRRIKRRTILEDDLLASLIQEPPKCCDRLCDGIINCNRTALERNNTRFDFGGCRFGWETLILRNHQSALLRQSLRQGICDIACAGKVVCNDT